MGILILTSIILIYIISKVDNVLAYAYLLVFLMLNLAVSFTVDYHFSKKQEKVDIVCKEVNLSPVPPTFTNESIFVIREPDFSKDKTYYSFFSRDTITGNLREYKVKASDSEIKLSSTGRAHVKVLTSTTSIEVKNSKLFQYLFLYPPYGPVETDVSTQYIFNLLRT